MARDSDWTCLILRFQVKCLFWFCDFSRLLDFIELKIGFRLKSDFREKEFRFVNRESLDQVSNSKALFVLSLCSTL